MSCLTCVASISVGFWSEEQGTRVLLFHFSRGQNQNSRPSVFLCSKTKRKRLLLRLSFHDFTGYLSVKSETRNV